MELTNVEYKKGIYKIFFDISFSINDSDIVVSEGLSKIISPKKISIASKNNVELFDLCKSCEWKNKVIEISDISFRQMEINGKKSIYSIDVWNKAEKIIWE